MAKRTASKELTHDNWEVEEHEEMGTFRQASADQLAGRSIRKAKRRGTNGDASGPSVFKGLSVLSGFGGPSETSAKPSFSFLSSTSKDSSESSSGKISFGAKSETLKVTQDSKSFGAKGSEAKSNGFLEGVDNSSDADGKSDSFLINLKALNEGVLVWIQKHLDKNPHVNLSPVFDDYKKHFSELLKKHPPELGNGKESEKVALTNSPRKDAAAGGKENTPLSQETTKESTAVKPFTFGIQKSPAEKNSEPSKSLFTFGSSSSETDKKSGSESIPTFSFTGFNSSGNTKSEGLIFGNSNNNKGSMFGGLSSLPADKGSNVGFSFSSSSSTATVVEKKDDSVKSEEPSDEPPKVEVNEVKEENALYEKKCKLFYSKEGSFVDRGVGTLYLKAAGEKTQLLVRAYTNLGNILLNIVLNSSIPTVRAGKNGVILACIPNPPLETNAEKSKEPVKMLIRVKTSEDADALLEKINEYKK